MTFIKSNVKFTELPVSQMYSCISKYYAHSQHKSLKRYSDNENRQRIYESECIVLTPNNATSTLIHTSTEYDCSEI